MHLRNKWKKERKWTCSNGMEIAMKGMRFTQRNGKTV